jgi:iron(III) transport system permease protein
MSIGRCPVVTRRDTTMSDRIVPMAEPASAHRRRFFHLDTGAALMWALLAAGCLVILPPFFYLIKSSVTVPLPGSRTAIGLGNYARVIDISGFDLWGVTIAFAAGTSLVAIFLGSSIAWLVARTNVAFRQAAFVGAFISLSAPLIVKGIGWILLLGPNNGLVNNWLRAWLGIEGTPIELFSLTGMILVEGLLWAPIAFLLILPPLAAMDPALEEAAAMCGARWWRTFWQVTLPLARPSILAVLILSFVRALESFEVPLLIGIPGGVVTVTTALYQSIHSGFIPRYGEASAYAVLLVIAVSLPLFGYYRATRASGRFATVTGKGFRPARLDLGRWKYPCALWVLIIPLTLAAPLLVMLWASFLPFYSSPSLDDLARMTLANYRAVWARDDILTGISNSLVAGTGSACIVAAGSLAMSWLVVRRRETIRWAIDGVASLPLVFPGIVLGIAILVEFLDLRIIPIYGTIFILIFAFVVKFTPYGMRFCYSGILSINRDLEDCAYVCGAGHFTVLRRIVLPLASPAIVATAIYVFMQAIRDLSVAILLSGPNNAIVSIVILDLWNNGEVPPLAALSVLIAAGATVLGLLFMRLSTRHRFTA